MSSGQPPGCPGKERGVLIDAKQAFQLSPFYLCVTEERPKHFLSKTQQNGALCLEKITYDEDNPNLKL